MGQKEIAIMRDEDNFYLQTECFYMCDQEVKGIIKLQRDKLLFKSKQGISQANLESLKQIDEELFAKEIELIEKQK